MDLKEFASKCQRKFASSVVVREQNRNGKVCQDIVAQGTRALDIADILVDEYKVPESVITIP